MAALPPKQTVIAVKMALFPPIPSEGLAKRGGGAIQTSVMSSYEVDVWSKVNFEVFMTHEVDQFHQFYQPSSLGLSFLLFAHNFERAERSKVTSLGSESCCMNS